MVFTNIITLTLHHFNDLIITHYLAQVTGLQDLALISCCSQQVKAIANLSSVFWSSKLCTMTCIRRTTLTSTLKFAQHLYSLQNLTISFDSQVANLHDGWLCEDISYKYATRVRTLWEGWSCQKYCHSKERIHSKDINSFMADMH